MRLPSKLLGCMRVGVGVGAVVLGGCDLASEAKARVLGEDAPAEQTPAEQTPAEQTAAEVPVEAAATPEPLLLGRSGVTGVVQDAVVRAKATEAPTRPPIADLGRPSTEPEGSRAFVPYDDGHGPLAVTPLAPERSTTAKPRPRKPKRARPIDEPCDPALATAAPPKTEWQCPACGRG